MILACWRASHLGSMGRRGHRQRTAFHQKIIAELDDAGYSFVATHTFLPRQYFLVFQRKSRETSPPPGADVRLEGTASGREPVNNGAPSERSKNASRRE
jgi:hypothetical protein